MPATQYPGKSILVVEDDALARQGLTQILEAAGCTVASAANGAEALRLLHAGPPPDLILLDLTMPVMDGWEFRSRQQQDPALARIPVVLVSGTGDLPQQAASLAAVSVLPKPIEFDRLLDTVRSYTTPQKPGVLVVDDEPGVRKLLELALGRHGFTVWSAAGGREAVEVYRRHLGDIALVLLDVQMPDLDGPWTLFALKGVNPQVRCCFMSGHTGEYDAEGLLALGASHVFPKPFGLAEITQALRRLLASP